MSIDNVLDRNEYANFGNVAATISDKLDFYSERGVSSTSVQEMSDLTLQRSETLRSLVNLCYHQVLKTEVEGIEKSPNIYSITEKGSKILEADEHKTIEHESNSYWVGRNEDTLTVIGPEKMNQETYMGEEIAKNQFFNFEDENIQTLLEE